MIVRVHTGPDWKLQLAPVVLTMTPSGEAGAGDR